MKYIKEALTGLALMIAGCSSCNSEQDVTPPVGPQVRMVEQDNKISFPDYDWTLADHRTLDFADAGLLYPGYATQGSVEHDGTAYDGVMDLADTNGDGNYDLIRITIDSTIISAPEPDDVGTGNSLRAIVHDVDHDGNGDMLLIDDLHGEDRGFDGIYDRVERPPVGTSFPMEDVIETWLILN